MSERFIPLTAGTSDAQLYAILNKNFGELDSEATTKVYRGANGNIAVIEGKLPYSGGFGSMYYNSNGIPSIIIGILPDGTVGIVQSKDDVDVTTVLS